MAGFLFQCKVLVSGCCGGKLSAHSCFILLHLVTVQNKIYTWCSTGEGLSQKNILKLKATTPRNYCFVKIESL